MVEQWNNHGGTVENLMPERWKRGVGRVEHHGGTVHYLMVEQWNI